MVLVTGGSYSGKTEYVKSRFNIEITNGEDCGFSDAFTAKCISKYHILVKRLLYANNDPVTFTEKLCGENTSLIVITDEIGCGIVPVEKMERVWREAAGKCGCMIAANSSEVIRLISGIPHKIK